eukprot:Tamp_15894.p1 GENE.Tamp_15894~~Tamp_15894.p1  ORF type:complete len:230 (+),score=29.34 Tamp_15894:682-1371(+)
MKLSDKIKAMAVLLDHTKGNSEEATVLAREALTQVAAAVADSGSLQKIFDQFIARVDAEMREKADSKTVQDLVSHQALSAIIDDLASTWGDQLQRAHADVSALKRGLKHVNDRSSAGLAKCLSCSGPMPNPKPALYWSRPGIDPVMTNGRSGTYRLAHVHSSNKPPRTAAPPGVGSSTSPSKRVSTALPELTPRDYGREDGGGTGGGSTDVASDNASRVEVFMHSDEGE